MKSSVLQARNGAAWVSTGVFLAGLLFAAIQAKAATPTYYWDTNGSDYGPGNPPTADWYEHTPCWTSDFYGTSPTFECPSRAHFVFAAAGDAYWSDTDNYTVTVHRIAQVSDLQFKDGNCTLITPPGYYLDKDTPFISVLNDGQTATINSVIASMTGTSNGITKYAWGTLVLGSTNTYRGPTTIEGGTLRLAAPQVLPPTSTLVLAGGDTRPEAGYMTSPTFGTGGYSQTLGPLLLTGPYTNLVHTIDFGHGASALAFADSHTQDWGGITLRLVNYKRGVDSLRFGTNDAGLTAAQLSLIRFADFLEVPGRIDANGFVTPVPPPTLSIKPTGSDRMVLTWGAIDGRSYNIQNKATLKDANWRTNSIQDVIATNNTASFTDNIGTNRSRFYRVLLRPVAINN